MDASVLAAIAFKEPEAARADALIGDGAVQAPRLIDYELASTARSKIRRNPKDRQSVLLMLSGILGSAIRRHDLDQPAVVQLALETGLSSYDASYLWLAWHLRVPLVTFDERLQRAYEGR